LPFLSSDAAKSRGGYGEAGDYRFQARAAPEGRPCLAFLLLCRKKPPRLNFYTIPYLK
jgi:hypothetical protein